MTFGNLGASDWNIISKDWNSPQYHGYGVPYLSLDPLLPQSLLYSKSPTP